MRMSLLIESLEEAIETTYLKGSDGRRKLGLMMTGEIERLQKMDEDLEDAAYFLDTLHEFLGDEHIGDDPTGLLKNVDSYARALRKARSEANMPEIARKLGESQKALKRR